MAFAIPGIIAAIAIAVVREKRSSLSLTEVYIERSQSSEKL